MKHYQQPLPRFFKPQPDKPAILPQADKISELVKAITNFTGPVICDWTDTFLSTKLYGRHTQYYCHRYFVESKIAIDKFYSKKEYEDGGADFKLAQLNAHGIRYIILTPEVSLEEAVIKAQAQRI